jgi:fatty-acyl-CoA synthase
MDGRAGMAALVTAAGFDVGKLGAALANSLPGYARPVFIRLLPAIDITGTFKQRKIELVKDGFDLSQFRDPIFWLDPETASYEPLTRDVYDAIVSGKVKL